MPQKIRETAGNANVERQTGGSSSSCTWIIEISSQIIFSTSAVVHFELLVGRNEKSVELGISSLTGHAKATPGQLQDHQQGKKSKLGRGAAQPKGVFSPAVNLIVDDTESLWNKPTLPEWDDEGKNRGKRLSYANQGEQEGFTPSKVNSRVSTGGECSEEQPRLKKRKRVHLVVLTHGLHSNLGADMLYLKESIDAAAKEARESARKRKADARRGNRSKPTDEAGTDEPRSSTAPLSGGQDDLAPGIETDEEDEEEVIVRGFAGNAGRTERGIQYLGKRLAKWVLSMTYPDQPFLPAKKSLPRKLSRVFTGDKNPDPIQDGPSTHNHSSIHRPSKNPPDLAYKITSISFIAHSLGGLTQTYAIAYIHKHSPNFFNEIKPINFVGMAVPFLGLSNENPLYVKFALDFGLVGRTGQDLGLTWRAPTMVRSGWGAMIGGIGPEGKRANRQPDPGAKPLLRILPTGHTHQVLKLFRNRTVYSNVVNDGIVPLRTSCLLFLDWSGLGRVEKARRENGLVGTMMGWGWDELTGTNKSSNRHLRAEQNSDAWSHSSVSDNEGGSPGLSRSEVPQPEEYAVKDDTTAQGQETRTLKQLPDGREKPVEDGEPGSTRAKDSSPQQPSHPLSGFLSFGLGLLRPVQPNNNQPSRKHAKIYKRSQTNKSDDAASPSSGSSSPLRPPSPANRPGMARGDSVLEDPNNVFTPPKTTIFEAAGDVLNPPLPSKEFLMNPQGRPRTIFHDRVYHPEDIPPPPTKKRPNGLRRTFSSDSRRSPARASDTPSDQSDEQQPDTSGMKVEEKISRAYHHGLSWRKVLVRLEPDAHNNMVVRRMFANAYGWPVVKHLVDTHFADTYAATTADADEPGEERAKPMAEQVGVHGEEVETERLNQLETIKRSESELREAKDSVSELAGVGDHSMSSATNRPTVSRKESATWEDSLFDISDDESDMGDPHQLRNSGHFSIPHTRPTADDDEENEDGGSKGTSEAEIAQFLSRSPPGVRTEKAGGEEGFKKAGGTTGVGLGNKGLRSPVVGRRGVGGAGREEEGKLEDEVQRVRIEDGQ